mmetsp:Transcript_9676/g.15522  ORF Transcript_9676/g.15522 Transcript_9676/m.15522 type:complete len:125 (-) Transcript_9676:982-1356(-)
MYSYYHCTVTVLNCTVVLQHSIAIHSIKEDKKKHKNHILPPSAILLLSFLFVETLHQSLGKFLTIESFSNEYEFINSWFIVLPGFLGGSKIDLFVHALKYEFCVSLPMKRQQSLGTINIGGPFS